RTPVSRLAADNPAHRWIMAQALGVVDILVSSKATEHRLSQQTRQRMATILAGPRVREAVAGHRGQAKRLVEFPVGHESSVGSYDRTAKLEHQVAVEIEPENIVRFTRWVRHNRSLKTRITY